MIKRISVVALAALFPAVAGAACVTADNLERGIRVDYEDDASEVIYRFGPNTLAADYLEGGQRTSRSLLLHGVYLVEYLGFDNGSDVPDYRDTYSFPPGPDGMPLPYPGGTFDVTATTLIDGSLDREAQSYVFGAEQSYQLSGCTYRMVPVLITYPDDPEPWTDYLNYLPDLGLSLYVASRDAEGLDEFPAVNMIGLE